MDTLNVRSDSPDWRARRLSNFSHDAFTLDGVQAASVEGFIQSILFPPEHPNHQLALGLSGKSAKMLGAQAERQYVWWKGHQFTFRSPEHSRLIIRAIRAKFEQSLEARRALLATVGTKFVHELDIPELPTTSLPANEFCSILELIRQEYIAEPAAGH